MAQVRKSSVEIERNDSGVGSETSKCSRSRWQHLPASQQHSCEDCDQPVETQVTDRSVHVHVHALIMVEGAEVITRLLAARRSTVIYQQYRKSRVRALENAVKFTPVLFWLVDIFSDFQS